MLTIQKFFGNQQSHLLETVGARSECGILNHFVGSQLEKVSVLIKNRSEGHSFALIASIFAKRSNMAFKFLHICSYDFNRFNWWFINRSTI